ncbi:hypothetical protein U1737_04855 [Sphingomonas sp. LB3N6]|uniref:hypothetical protein n=1 Tax=Sphingomonas fucosidasi TaxID=3096164 RepID=UPI002FC8331B
MTVDRTKSLTEIYHGWISSTVDEKGFEIPHGLIIDQAGGMTVVALAVPPEQAYQVMIEQWGRGASEAIFALDRFGKPDQGTTLGDVMAGFHFTRDAAPRPFIVEYQHSPRIVKPIEWNNLFWNGALYRELNANLRKLLGVSQL